MCTKINRKLVIRMDPRNSTAIQWKLSYFKQKTLVSLGNIKKNEKGNMQLFNFRKMANDDEMMIISQSSGVFL